MTISTRTSFNDFLPYFFDTKLGSNLFANLLLYHFGVKRAVPANFGDTIRIPRPKRTNIIGAAPAEGTLLTLSQLSGESVSGQLKKFAGAYGVSDLVVLTAMSDVVQIHVDMLGRDIAQAMDDHIQNQLSATTVQYTVGPSPGYLSQNLRSGAKLTATQILRAVNLLEEMNNPRPDIGFFPLIIRPAAAYDIQSRVSGNAWVAINQYATDATVAHLYKAAIGDLYGARIFKSTRMKKYLTGLSAGVSGYRSLLLGPEAFYITEISEAAAQVIVKPLGAGGTYDPDNSIGTVAAKVFFTAIPAAFNSTEKRMARLIHAGQLI